MYKKDGNLERIENGIRLCLKCREIFDVWLKDAKKHSIFYYFCSKLKWIEEKVYFDQRMFSNNYNLMIICNDFAKKKKTYKCININVLKYTNIIECKSSYCLCDQIYRKIFDIIAGPTSHCQSLTHLIRMGKLNNYDETHFLLWFDRQKIDSFTLNLLFYQQNI